MDQTPTQPAAAQGLIEQLAGRDRSPVRDFATAAVDVQSRAHRRRFVASTPSSAHLATDLLAVESPEPAETMEGGGGAAAHDPAASTEAAAAGMRNEDVRF